MERDAGEGPQKSVCLLGSLFTFLRVILAPGGSKAGGPTCCWGLSVFHGPAGTVAAPGHLGGKYTYTHRYTSCRKTTGYLLASLIKVKVIIREF